MEAEHWKVLGWQLSEGRFFQKFIFKDFQEALAFINTVGILSENVQHHPKIINLYNTVTLELWTHDANGITTKDYQWMQEFQKLSTFKTEPR